MTEVPYVLVGDLTEAQRRAYIIADNRLTELGEWDADKLRFEMGELQAMHFDTTLTGFELGEVERIEVAGYTRAKAAAGAPDMDALSTADGESDEEYEAFVEKFKPKLTTDDCYTPKAVYEAVRDWVVAHYGIEVAPIVRPFYPGGDYQSYDYPEGCVVLDNPPFSIISEICRFYMARGIRFFLFAPALTLFSIAAGECHYIPTSCAVTYENGAVVRTGFVHNLGDFKLETAPELYAAVAAADAESAADELPAYTYPDCVATPIRLAPMARYEHFAVRESECRFIRALDAQKEAGKTIYGAAFLLSEKAAAEKAAAERRASHTWELSEREREIVASLG